MRSDNLFEGGRALRIAVGITVLGLLLAGAASAATWTVDDSGGANFTRIQDAIYNAGAGDTILVYSGTYYENVNVNKQLILRGIDMPVVDAQKSGSANALAADGVRLEGFITKNSDVWPNAGIKVTSNSNTLSGNNANSNTGAGIELYSSSNNNTLNGNNASNNSYGIYLDSSSNNKLNGNNASYNNASYSGYGIYLYSSSNNTLSGNKASNNSYSIFLYSSSNNSLNGNNANSNYWDGICLISSSNNKLNGNNASNNSYGIYLDSSSNNKLNGNNASNNFDGIYLDSSSNNNKLSDNNANSNNNYGIYLGSSSNNTLSGNNANSNNGLFGEGIILVFSSNNNKLSGNNASNNFDGISLWDSSNNKLSGNNANSNNNYGIYLGSSSNNNIYDNIFNNTNNLYIQNSISTWNISKTPGTNIIGGSYFGGNFWANPSGTGFSQTCPDNNKDGLCDVQYTLADNNSDYLPLTVPTTPTAGSISGFKVNDANGNGKWDVSEKGISNWTIRLIGIIGNGKNAKVIRKETSTDATGFYKFDNLPAGRYFVIEKLKKGFVATSSPVKRMKLAQGKNSMNNNFTNRPVHSRDEKNENRDIDDYENINRDIDKYKEDTNWG